MLIWILETYPAENCTKKGSVQNGALRIREPTVCTYWRWLFFVETKPRRSAQILFKLILIFLEAKNSSRSDKKQSALPKVEEVFITNQHECLSWAWLFGPTKCFDSRFERFRQSAVQLRVEGEKPQDIEGSDISKASLHQLVFQQTGTETTGTHTHIHTHVLAAYTHTQALHTCTKTQKHMWLFLLISPFVY